MEGFIAPVLTVVVVTIVGILLVATLSMPVSFAGAITALGVGVVAAIMRYWPKKKG